MCRVSVQLSATQALVSFMSIPPYNIAFLLSFGFFILLSILERKINCKKSYKIHIFPKLTASKTWSCSSHTSLTMIEIMIRVYLVHARWIHKLTNWFLLTQALVNWDVIFRFCYKLLREPMLNYCQSIIGSKLCIYFLSRKCIWWYRCAYLKVIWSKIETKVQNESKFFQILLR